MIETQHSAGLIIRRLRTERKITQKEMANKMGGGQSRISQLEDLNKNDRLELQTLARAAKALGVELTVTLGHNTVWEVIP